MTASIGLVMWSLNASGSELCRFLAATHRDEVLATPRERRANAPDDLAEILQLEEWFHPDLACGELPSSTETFQTSADVLVSGEPSRYKPARNSNTRWDWPEGGTLQPDSPKVDDSTLEMHAGSSRPQGKPWPCRRAQLISPKRTVVGGASGRQRPARFFQPASNPRYSRSLISIGRRLLSWNKLKELVRNPARMSPPGRVSAQ